MSTLDAVDVALVAAQVDGADGEEVDAELEPEADDGAPVELDRERGAADGAEHLHLGLAHEARVEELADQARDRRLVEPGALGDRRAGAGAALRDVTQHHAEVVPADGALVGGDAPGIVGLHAPDLNANGGAAQPRNGQPSASAGASSAAAGAAGAVTSRAAPQGIGYASTGTT